MRHCSTCGCEIPKERLEILPHATTCVKHSTTKRPRGFMANTTKTDQELCLISNVQELSAWRKQNWRDNFTVDGKPKSSTLQMGFRPEHSHPDKSKFENM